MSDDLAAFLAARYDEAAAVAKAAADEGAPDWHLDPDDYFAGRIHDGRGNVVVYDEGSPGPNQAEHITANDPAHRLADITLKRAIIALHATKTTREQQRAFAQEIAEGKPPVFWVDMNECTVCGWFDAEHGGCATTRQLGTEFAAHPAYKLSWAPD